MEIRSVGSLEVSVAGLGCNNFGMRIDEAASKAVVDAALDAGVNHFDTADIYGEGHVGGVPRPGARQPPRRRRHHHQVRMGVPEGEPRRASEARVTRVLDESLARLGTDYIDLYLLHHPDPIDADRRDLSAFAKLVAAGKVREIGCSNFTGARARRGRERSRRTSAFRAFVNAQNDYSLVEPRGRGRRPPRVRAPRHHVHAVLPVGERRAHRQVPQG